MSVVCTDYRSHPDTGIKGPVLIDFPIDVLFSPPQLHRIAFGAVDVPAASPPAPDPAALDRLLAAWKAAKRPAIINGTGVRGAGNALQRLAETTSTPVFYCKLDLFQAQV